MDYFDITFRFNNEDKTLDRFNGLSIDVLGDFLKSLYAVTKGVSDDNLVLSEIKGNCYALVCSTPNITTSEYIQNLHAQIANGNFSALKSKEIDYSKKVMDILSDNLTLNVYNSDKSFYKTIQKKEQPVTFPYFYETDAICGILTRIGGRNINTKNTILISSYSGEIEISNSQDQALRNHYKNGSIEFYITKKVNKDTLKVEKTTLDDFVIFSPQQLSFAKTIEEIRAKYGRYFATTEIEE